MGFVYHLGSNGASPAKYVQITGEAAAPVVEIEVTINPTDALHDSYAIFSTDGGTVLWYGGTHGNGVPANALGVHRSIDGGATWTNKGLDLPVTNGWQSGACFGGFADDPLVVLGMHCSSCQASFNKFNAGTDQFANTQNGGRPNTIWACEFSGRMYAIDGAYPGTTPRLMYSDDRGATWVHDATYGAPAFNFAQHVVTDPRNGRIYGLYGAANAVVRWSDAIGSSWTQETVLAGSAVLELTGRHIGCDETGAVWALVYVGGIGQRVVRRDPGTGLWSVSLIGTSGAQGSIWVIDSENILVSGNGNLHFWDGTIWHTHTHVVLGIAGASHSAIWGPRPLTESSVLNPGFEIAGANRGEATAWTRSSS